MKVPDNELHWRFAHEPEAETRRIKSDTHKFRSAGRRQARILLQREIEAWLAPVRSECNEGDTVNIVVTYPPNMAGLWRIKISTRPRVFAECIEGRFAPAQQ